MTGPGISPQAQPMNILSASQQHNLSALECHFIISAVSIYYFLLYYVTLSLGEYIQQQQQQQQQQIT